MTVVVYAQDLFALEIFLIFESLRACHMIYKYISGINSQKNSLISAEMLIESKFKIRLCLCPN